MILTCPDCATSYFVEDARVPAQGRTVKCSSCGARWRAVAESEPEADDEITFEPVAQTPVAAVEEPPPEIDPADDLEIVMAQFRQPAAAAAKSARKPRTALWAGVGLAATVALVVGGAILFRDGVVRFAPVTGRLYAQLGLPAGRQGLLIAAVKSQATFQGGRPVLSVTGEIRNTAIRTVSAPALRVSLLDKSGKTIAAKLARPLNAAVPAGAKRYFAIAISDPPAGLNDLEVVFDTGAGAHAAEAVLTAEPGDGHG